MTNKGILLFTASLIICVAGWLAAFDAITRQVEIDFQECRGKWCQPEDVVR